jgi:dTDP-4-dehydrorhamnose reductase
VKVAIFGASGQLGRDVADALSAHELILVDHARADVRRAEAVSGVLQGARPQWVVNCAAMTHVDRCETSPLEAFDANALGARNIVRAAREVGARLLHVSTDYVFDGEKDTAYVEDDVARPVNVYGMSKLAGEWFVRAEGSEHAVVRSSGLYGVHPCRGKGTNFVETILARAREGAPLRVVSDERLTPTFTEDLAAQMRTMIEHAVPGGVYHATNAGSCSWYEFAKEIVRLARTDAGIEPIPAAQWKSASRRPANSSLENRALRSLGLDTMPEWRDALSRYLAKRGTGER